MRQARVKQSTLLCATDACAGAKGPHRRRAEPLQAYDTNGDGVLDRRVRTRGVVGTDLDDTELAEVKDFGGMHDVGVTHTSSCRCGRGLRRAARAHSSGRRRLSARRLDAASPPPPPAIGGGSGTEGAAAAAGAHRPTSSLGAHGWMRA